MADFYRTNGSVGTIGTFVSLIGKTPKAFGIRIAGTAGQKDVSGELGVNGAVQDIFKMLSANATILGYQIENNSTGNVSVLIEGGDNLSAATVQSIIRTGGNGAGGYGNSSPQLDAGSTLVTDVGFKLAYS
jgi:hypothetical protein